MVVELSDPSRPLPTGGATWTWKQPRRTGRWEWCRVYHRGPHASDGHTGRGYGPLARFDPHRPDQRCAPQLDPDGRTVLYAGHNLATSLCEVFGAAGVARLCPRWRAAILIPTTPLVLFDLTSEGSAMAIGALPALADAALPRALTQHWARAIYEDQPGRRHVTGIRYRSAYNGGLSLALWDADPAVATLLDPNGQPADRPLIDDGLLVRVKTALAPRHIDVEVVESRDCALCRTSP